MARRASARVHQQAGRALSSTDIAHVLGFGCAALTFEHDLRRVP